MPLDPFDFDELPEAEVAARIGAALDAGDEVAGDEVASDVLVGYWGVYGISAELHLEGDTHRGGGFGLIITPIVGCTGDTAPPAELRGSGTWERQGTELKFTLKPDEIEDTGTTGREASHYRAAAATLKLGCAVKGRLEYETPRSGLSVVLLLGSCDHPDGTFVPGTPWIFNAGPRAESLWA